ncbi:PREDICTED: glutathione S-transferase U17-like [Tarenaya hassleriana]|uniref:glutathione S-transferase U17-like n=1 Tax=Tarenaya hassleriana TaxID=28532 RepID=UPI00053C4FA1|nr:PREDICTED: glutathione S-transferase U17-like [Tarenaya hassleriana]
MAISGDVKLLSLWSSPYAMRAMIALGLKSVSYELQEEILASKSELLLRSNPVHKKVPVLIHKNKPVCESLIIVEYIDEVWSSSGPSFLPSDPYDRAVARFWGAYIDEKFFATLREILRAEGEEAKRAAMAKAEEQLALLDKAFAESSNGNPFFNGGHIGYVDIALGSILAWVSVIELVFGRTLVDETKTPVLSKWAERFRSDPVVRSAMPETEKLVEYAKKVFPKLLPA